MENEKDYYLFYGGLFSQWADIPMVIDGVEYSCNEQYMMAEKARLFGDDEMHAKIMASDNPEEMKMKFGRHVRNFDDSVWKANARDIVYKANYAKFTQNYDCLLELAYSRGKTVVEASPTDKIWGIGLDQFDPRATDESQWQGTNWLGEAIMKVRDELEKDGWFAEIDKRIKQFEEEPYDPRLDPYSSLKVSDDEFDPNDYLDDIWWEDPRDKN